MNTTASSKIVSGDRVLENDILIDSPEWAEWLGNQSSFRYEEKDGGKSFTCNRRSNGKWYGVKKVHSSAKGNVAVTLYIGSDQDCSLSKLQEILGHFSLSPGDFWRWYDSPERKAQRKNKLKSLAVVQELPGVQPTPAEVESLQARLAELEKENSQLKGKLEVAGELSTQQRKEIGDLQWKITQQESHIRAMHSELLNRPHPEDLIRRKVVELGMQEQLMQHQQDSKKAVRYWALAKLLEALSD